VYSTSPVWMMKARALLPCFSTASSRCARTVKLSRCRIGRYHSQSVPPYSHWMPRSLGATTVVSIV
jgi:hypothetical protein